MRMIAKQSISATTRIWVDLHHQYGISWLVAQTSVFAWGRPAEREQAAVYSGYLLISLKKKKSGNISPQILTFWSFYFSFQMFYICIMIVLLKFCSYTIYIQPYVCCDCIVLVCVVWN